MILKIKYQPGRTAYFDLGNEIIYTERHGDGFADILKTMGINDESEKDCIGVISGRDPIPIYDCFATEIYSNDGQLFMGLTFGDKTITVDDKLISRPTLKELQEMLHKMDYYKVTNGFMSVNAGKYVFFEDKKYDESIPINREWILKMIDEA